MCQVANYEQQHETKKITIRFTWWHAQSNKEKKKNVIEKKATAKPKLVRWYPIYEVTTAVKIAIS